jgi:hypothetical protein
MTSCTICGSHDAIHWHHTIPRSRGGELSKQIPLCASCHNTLHHHALYLKSKINNKKPLKSAKVFWSNPEHERIASPYLNILVQALCTPIPSSVARTHVLSVEVDTETFENFKLAQLQLNVTQAQLMLQSINSYIQQVVGEVNNDNNNKMWFM